MQHFDCFTKFFNFVIKIRTKLKHFSGAKENLKGYNFKIENNKTENEFQSMTASQGIQNFDFKRVLKSFT